MKIDLALLEAQERFVLSEARFPAYVGGFGAGKSEALVDRLLLKKLKYPRGNVGYFAPTFDLIRLIAYPRFQATLESWGIGSRLNKSDKVLYVETGGQVIFRTLDVPDSIVGFEITDAGLDELDTLKPEHASNAWNKVIARCRQKKPDGEPNTAAVATTPEGFRFVYKRWKESASPAYELIQAKTLDNPFLPEDYVESLRATYPPQLLKAYLDGEFVNLTSGAVYPDFSRVLNDTDATLRDGETIHVGLDFNVHNCTAIIFVIRDDKPIAVQEIIGLRDTPAVCTALNERFPSRRIEVYPDASGASHKTTNASISDIELLKQAKLQVNANPANPAVRDRVLSVNAMILNARGDRQLKVNTKACPKLTTSFEQQAYDKAGDPDKDSGLDHPVDAAGYFINWRFPVKRPVKAFSANWGRV